MRKAEMEWKVLVVVLRLIRGWTPEELAEAAGVPVSAIALQERSDYPDRAVRDQVAQALGIAGRIKPLQRYFGQLRSRMAGEYRVPKELWDPRAPAERLTAKFLEESLDELREIFGGYR